MRDENSELCQDALFGFSLLSPNNPFETRGPAPYKSYFICYPLSGTRFIILIFYTILISKQYILLYATRRIPTCRALIFHMDQLHLPSCSSASLTFVRIPIVNFTAVVPHHLMQCAQHHHLRLHMSTGR